MALTQSEWTSKTVNHKAVHTCTVLPTTAETDAYTLKTPRELDTSKPFTVVLQFSGTPDASALPVDLWIGYGEDFALSGQGASVIATNGANFKQMFDNVVGAVANAYAFLVDPELIVDDVVTLAAIASGPKIKAPAVPYFAFNLDGGSTLAAQTATWIIIQ